MSRFQLFYFTKRYITGFLNLTMDKDKRCLIEGTLLACPNNPVLYVVAAIFLALFIFYLIRLIIVIKQAFSTQFKTIWPSLVFWICMMINPAIEFIHYFASNYWVSTFEMLVFLIFMPFFENFPYISLTMIVLRFEKLVSSSSEKNKEKKVYWALGVFSLIFIIEIIIFFTCFHNHMLYMIIDAINDVNYLIAITTFFFVCINTINTIYSLNITAFPVNFYRNLLIGFNAVTVLNLIYVITRTYFYSYVNFSGISSVSLALHQHKFFMGFQEFYEIFGVALPHLIISIGILYLNSIPNYLATSV